MVSALGRVPDELAHQGGGLGLDGDELTADSTGCSMCSQKLYLTKALSCVSQQRRGRCLVIPGVQVVHMLTQLCHCDQVHTARPLQGVAQPLISDLCIVVGLGEQRVELIDGHPEDARELGPQPR